MQCASCVGDKLARHTFPDQGSDAENVLDVVHIDLCGPFRVAANDGSLYFLLLKDRKTRYVWVRPIAKKSDMLVIFDKWLKVVERKTSKTVKMLCFDRGGEFLDQAFTDLVEEKGILHNLTVRGFPSRSSPYTPQQNGMAKREMRTVDEAVRTMLLHMGVKHHWWHLDLRQAVWVHNCLERASLPSGMTPHELLFEKKPDLTMAQVWGYMVQEQDASTRTPSAPPPDSSSEMPPLLADIDEHEDKDVEEVPLPPPIVPLSATSSPSPSPPVVDLPQKRSSSDAVDEGRLGASPAAPTSCIAGGRRNAEKVADGHGRDASFRGAVSREADPRRAVGRGAADRGAVRRRLVENVVEVICAAGGDEGELSTGEQSDDNNVVEVAVEKEKPRCSNRPNIGKPPEKLSYHACLPPMTYSTLLNDAEDNADLPELNLDMHADPEHR
ncbi:unnamed protein product [Closterium sp. NIES-54]